MLSSVPEAARWTPQRCHICLSFHLTERCFTLPTGIAITHPVLLDCCTVHHTLRSSQHRGSFAGHAGAASLCGPLWQPYRARTAVARPQHSCCSAVLKAAQHQIVALLGALTPVQASQLHPSSLQWCTTSALKAAASQLLLHSWNAACYMVL